MTCIERCKDNPLNLLELNEGLNFKETHHSRRTGASLQTRMDGQARVYKHANVVPTYNAGLTNVKYINTVDSNRWGPRDFTISSSESLNIDSLYRVKGMSRPNKDCRFRWKALVNHRTMSPEGSRED
jgi:hypothetical protein